MTIHLTIHFIWILLVNLSTQKEYVPTILAWTGVFQKPELHTWLHNKLTDEKCSKQCNFIPRSEMKEEDEYAAIIFHSRDINHFDLPNSRKIEQLYLLFALEAPGNRVEHRFEKFPPNFFNGTIGYSRLNNYTYDYDFPATPNPHLIDDIIRNKTSSVLGVISNCNSQSGRESIIDRLQKHINLTLRGACYHKRISNEELDMLIKTHRFIIALENKDCPEYVTEKAYKYKKLIVPIVRDCRLVGDSLPSDAFIAIDDFEHTSELANYLKRLQRNDDEYKKFFNWMERKDGYEVRRRGICELCIDLHSRPLSRHSSLFRAAFPDENTCITTYAHPWKLRNNVVVLCFISVLFLAIGARWLFRSYKRYRGYVIVKIYNE